MQSDDEDECLDDENGFPPFSTVNQPDVNNEGNQQNYLLNIKCGTSTIILFYDLILKLLYYIQSTSIWKTL